MATKQTKSRLAHANLNNKRGTTVISPNAMLAWRRVPTQNKDEIIKAFQDRKQESDSSVTTVRIGSQAFRVRRMSSGFRIIYESGEDHDTIVSVVTPREARLARV